MTDVQDINNIPIQFIKKNWNTSNKDTNGKYELRVNFWIENNTIQYRLKLMIYSTNKYKSYNDNEINILPNSIQINEAKTKIIDTANGGIKPANMNDNSVIVLSPIPYTVNFNFSSLTPNTSQMREAVKNRLTDYFRSIEVSLGKDISEATYNNVIYSTIDSQGKSPSAFTLTSPTGNIDITSNQLPILGDITF